MASADQVKVVLLQELLQLLSAKHESAPSLIFFPVTSVFVRVVPEEVRHQSTVWHICGLGDLLDLLKRMHSIYNLNENGLSQMDLQSNAGGGESLAGLLATG